jgi:hypothetical protein
MSITFIHADKLLSLMKFTNFSLLIPISLLNIYSNNSIWLRFIKPSHPILRREDTTYFLICVFTPSPWDNFILRC